LKRCLLFVITTVFSLSLLFTNIAQTTPNDRTALEQSARSAIRIYAQVCGMESVPSAATYEIGLIHKRLGNDKDAMQCFDKVIDIDPDGRHGNYIYI
jgi:hypothetical protein